MTVRLGGLNFNATTNQGDHHQATNGKNSTSHIERPRLGFGSDKQIEEYALQV